MFPRRATIILVGDSQCGKSSILKQFCEKKFEEGTNPTIGVDYGSKIIASENQPVILSFFDLSGSPEYINTRVEFYGEASGIVIVFDITSKLSFKRLEKWFREIDVHRNSSAESILCGNKSDLQAAVRRSEIDTFCKSHGVRFLETSAKTGLNIDQTFQELLHRIN